MHTEKFKHRVGDIIQLGNENWIVKKVKRDRFGSVEYTIRPHDESQRVTARQAGKGETEKVLQSRNRTPHEAAREGASETLAQKALSVRDVLALLRVGFVARGVRPEQIDAEFRRQALIWRSARR